MVSTQGVEAGKVRHLVQQQQYVMEHLDLFVQEQHTQLQRLRQAIESHFHDVESSMHTDGEMIMIEFLDAKSREKNADSVAENPLAVPPQESRTGDKETTLAESNVIMLGHEKQGAPVRLVPSLPVSSEESESTVNDTSVSCGLQSSELLCPDLRGQSETLDSDEGLLDRIFGGHATGVFNGGDGMSSTSTEGESSIQLSLKGDTGGRSLLERFFGGDVSSNIPVCAESWETSRIQDHSASGDEELVPSNSRVGALKRQMSNIVRPRRAQIQMRASHIAAANQINMAYASTAKIRQESGRTNSRILLFSDSVLENSLHLHKRLRTGRLCGLRRLERFVESKHFKVTVVVLIVLNALFIGVSTDLTIKSSLETFDNQSEGQHATAWTSDWLFGIDLFFNTIFILELLLRVLAQECAFCCGSEWSWNIFDAVVVVLSLLEMSLLVVGFNSSYIRVLRLARVVRSMRMLRVFRFLPVFHKLHAMTLAIVRCRLMLMCAVFVLLMFMFLFSIMFTNAVASYVEEAEAGNEHVDEMRLFFGSLPMTMLTLFMTVSGGVDWWDVARLLLELSGFYIVLFLLFVTIIVLAVLNVINAIFVNDAVEATRNDLDLRLEAEERETKVMLQRLRRIFREMDRNSQGQITLSQFTRHVEREHMKMVLSLIGLSFTDGVALFRLLDVDQNGYLTIEEFVMGCLRLKGGALMIDLFLMVKETREFVKKATSAPWPFASLSAESHPDTIPDRPGATTGVSSSREN